MSELNKIKVKLDSILIAEYENYVVYAIYINGKFSSTLTINLDEVEEQV